LVIVVGIFIVYTQSLELSLHLTILWISICEDVSGLFVSGYNICISLENIDKHDLLLVEVHFVADVVCVMSQSASYDTGNCHMYTVYVVLGTIGGLLNFQLYEAS